MLEVYGDLWTYYPKDNTRRLIPCITTNGFVKKNGEAVMGRGVAKQCLEMYPSVSKILGGLILTFGNKLLLFYVDGKGSCIISFPVKHHWKELASLTLISISAWELRNVALATPNKLYVLPRPGCGNGQRDWVTEVKPIIEPILPDNVHVITNRSPV